MELNIDDLRNRLEYVEETGWLRWKVSLKRTGKIGGYFHPNGYVMIVIDGVHHRAHRIIWAIKTGEQPPELIDHKDENGYNNKWDNLRINTKSGNGFNRADTKGVYRTPSGTWHAFITYKYQRMHLGSFATEEEALSARAKQRQLYLEGELSSVR